MQIAQSIKRVLVRNRTRKNLPPQLLNLTTTRKESGVSPLKQNIWKLRILNNKITNRLATAKQLKEPQGKFRTQLQLFRVQVGCPAHSQPRLNPVPSSFRRGSLVNER